MRGDVSDYLATTRSLLTEDGDCFIANGGSVDRTQNAATKLGFFCESRWDLVGIVGKSVLFSVYHFKLISPCGGSDVTRVQTVFVRDELGQFTERYLGLVERIGKPRGSYEPHSVPGKYR